MLNRRYHFHSPGLIYVFITILIAIGAFNSQNNLLFAAFGFALALLVVSGVISGSMLMAISAERLPVSTSAVREPAVIRYRIRNRNRWLPAFALTIEEIEPAPPRRRRLRNGKEQTPTDGWQTRLPTPRAFAPHVPPSASVEVEAAVAPHHRGLATLVGFRVGTTFPFGLIRKSLYVEQHNTVLIRPELVEIDTIPDQRATSGSGSTAVSRAVGADNEFFALREYVPGDPQRTIAWVPSARTEALLVRQHIQPATDRTWAILQLDAADDPDITERSISLAASVINHAAGRASEIGLLIPALGITVQPRPGIRHRDQLLDTLALLKVPQAATPQDIIEPAGDVIRITRGEATGRAGTIVAAAPRSSGGHG